MLIISLFLLRDLCGAMEVLPENPLLKYNPNTLQEVRKLFNLEDHKRLEDAIDILQEWARKQEHFVVKEFDRDFLERLIISNKGLIERSKVKLDKCCTIRNLMPEFYKVVNIKTDLCNLDFFIDAAMPKMTPDNCRVYVLKNTGQNFSAKLFMDYYIRQIIMWQYLIRYDYNAGFIIIYDFTDVNMVDLISNVNLADFRNITALITEGYGSRIRASYLISNSKIVNALVDLVKSLLSKKLSDRLQVIDDIETLKTKLPQDILPSEYGGKEKTLPELHKDWLDVCSSEDHLTYVKKMAEYRTNESLRQVDKFNEEYLGMPGTFRSLSVD